MVGTYASNLEPPKVNVLFIAHLFFIIFLYYSKKCGGFIVDRLILARNEKKNQAVLAH